MRQTRWLLAVCVVGIIGCGTSTGVKRSGSTPFTGDATPTLLVNPITSNAATSQPGRLNSEELTQLLLAQLRAKGIRAFRENADSPTDYVLSCTVPRLGYSIRRRYPTYVQHAAMLSCSIIDPSTQVVRWHRDVERHNDVTTLLNTMTKLPPRHESELLQECVLPVWDGMAYSVRLFLDRPQYTAAPTPVVPAAPERQATVNLSDTYSWMK